MTDEEKQVLKTFKKGYGLTQAERKILSNLIEKLQQENEKQEKVIDEMASRIEILDDDFGAFKEGIKQYYYRKVEEDEKEKI